MHTPIIPSFRHLQITRTQTALTAPHATNTRAALRPALATLVMAIRRQALRLLRQVRSLQGLRLQGHTQSTQALAVSATLVLTAITIRICLRQARFRDIHLLLRAISVFRLMPSERRE